MSKPNWFFAAFISLIASGLLLPATTSFAANIYKGAGYKGEITTAIKKQPVISSCPPPPISLKEGAYFGASGGYDSYKIHERSQLARTSLFASYNPTISATGLIGGILAGYGRYFNGSLYLGGEAFANISEAYQSTNASISDADTSDFLSINSKFFATTGYGFSLLPGVKLNEGGLFFARLGYHVARLRGQENVSFNRAPYLSNTSSWSGGFGYGLGFEEAMVENFSLRGEFIHVDYRTFTATSGTEYSASNNQFMLSLIYHL